MSHGGEYRDIGAPAAGADDKRHRYGRTDEVDPARIDDNQLGALAQTALHAAGEHRVAVSRIGADQQHDIGVHHAVEILRARRSAEGLAEAEAGRRVADARAGVDIVGTEACADQLLHEEGFLVRAARACDAA